MSGYAFTACCLHCREATPLVPVTLGRAVAGTYTASMLECPACHRTYLVNVTIRPVAKDPTAAERTRRHRSSKVTT